MYADQRALKSGTLDPRGLGVAVAILCALVPAQGLAQSCADVNIEALYQQGRDLRTAGQNDAALELFQRAYACRRDALGLARIALTEVALSRWLAAEEHLEEALRDTASGWINQNRAQLTSTLGQVKSHIALLEVRCNVRNAELRVFGGLTYRLSDSRPIRLVVTQETTELDLEFNAPEHRPARRSVRVFAGASRVASVDVHLDPITPPQTPPPPAPTSNGEDPGPGPWPWVIASIGGASVIAGVVVLAVPLSVEDSTFQRLCPNGVCSPDNQPEGRAVSDRIALLQVIGWTLVGSGATALLCGLGWSFNEHLRRAAGSPVSSTSPRVSFGLGLDGSLRVGGVF